MTSFLFFLLPSQINYCSPLQRSALPVIQVYAATLHGVICDQCEHCLNDAPKAGIGVAPDNKALGLKGTKLMGREQNWMRGIALHVLEILHCVKRILEYYCDFTKRSEHRCAFHKISTLVMD